MVGEKVAASVSPMRPIAEQTGARQQEMYLLNIFALQIEACHDF